MADNQITPFQLTDQFTMDNFNQRINETNTALQKKVNPNLLDNPWFTVNQRGKQKYTHTDYIGKITLDRWRLDGGSFSIVPNSPYGVHMEDCTGSSQISQTFPSSCLVIGKTYTCSVNVNGTIYSVSGVYTGPSEEAYHRYCSINKDGIGLAFRQHNLESDNVQFVFTFTLTQPFYVYAFKLELGSVSTLANDVPPNYQQELAKCQRYCYVIHNVDSYSQVGTALTSPYENGCRASISLPVPMRSTPSVTISGEYYVLYKGTALPITGVDWTASNTPNAVRLALHHTANSALTADAIGLLSNATYSGSSMVFSAEL